MTPCITTCRAPAAPATGKVFAATCLPSSPTEPPNLAGNARHPDRLSLRHRGKRLWWHPLNFLYS